MSSATEPTEAFILSTIEDGISEYYELKDLYKKKVDIEKKRFLLQNKQLSLVDKRTRLRLLLDGVKCIKCGQIGGMTFLNSAEELRITCNAIQPCMNRLIKKPKYAHLETLMYATYDEIEELKHRTIQLKLNLLFNYATEETTLSEFGKLQKQLNQLFAKYDRIRARYYDVVSNAKRSKTLADLDVQISTLIQKIKQDLSTTTTTSASSVDHVAQPVVADTVNTIVTRLTPLLEMYADIKYVFNEMIPRDSDDAGTSSSNNQHRLIQKSISLRELVQPI
jgi:hypothetical protein